MEFMTWVHSLKTTKLKEKYTNAYHRGHVHAEAIENIATLQLICDKCSGLIKIHRKQDGTFNINFSRHVCAKILN